MSRRALTGDERELVAVLCRIALDHAHINEQVGSGEYRDFTAEDFQRIRAVLLKIEDPEPLN